MGWPGLTDAPTCARLASSRGRPGILNTRSGRCVAAPNGYGSTGACALPLRYVRPIDGIRIGLTCLLVLVLIGCGREGTTHTPEQAHREWVGALRKNDRAAALELAGPAVAPYLDSALHNIQVELRSPVLGPLQTIDIGAPIEAGQGKVGWSVWTFANREQCYATTLAAIDDAWTVTDWQRHPCQEMPSS
jgi:hypothetical protein